MPTGLQGTQLQKMFKGANGRISMAGSLFNHAFLVCSSLLWISKVRFETFKLDVLLKQARVDARLT